MKKLFNKGNAWFFGTATLVVLFMSYLTYLDNHKKVGHETLTVHNKHAVNLVMTCDKNASEIEQCTFSKDNK